MDLELLQNRNDLVYEKEYNLNTKPLEIDLLIIKKDASVHITNEIGYLFRGHNIVEYKSPEDHLDIDTFYKSMAYAGLYKSYGRTVDEIKADDVTVSIIRETKPAGLFRYFEEHAYPVTNPYKGVYYKADQELADSILEVCIGANSKLIEEFEGDESMYEVLMEILEPKIKLREDAIRKEERNQGLKEGRKEGIQGTIVALRDLGQGNADIKETIMRVYGLSDEEAAEEGVKNLVSMKNDFP